ncbi:hypothetical protein C8P68_105380 [Mucilaginibacter yixingensis]|uniref:Uncharacterized protein n=1 Tax=Mucilaginibacter yixingensis TaxID=1295612 RepID=A0A2T5J8Z6_9SPHI|nr:hypothetical protein [Mucilaginibacter yixingensis]PTQ95869.1 hypothetical protein C8P68_105380 [Mucilaginibacter yixingensis]
MSQYPAKLRTIFLPFLIISVFIICIYTFLNWLLLIKYQAFVIDETIVQFFIPMVLPWIPLLIWMRPRLKLLKLDVSRGRNPVAGLLMLLWIIIALPMAFAQRYMVTATGKLTQLDAMSQIATKPPTKYYKVKNFYADKIYTHARSIFNVSGKYNRDYDITIYLAVPIFDHKIEPDSVWRLKVSAAVRPLFVVNGVIVPDSLLSRIDKKHVDRITIIKNRSAAIELYGQQAKNGVVMITTKGLNRDLKPTDPPPAIKWPIAWMGFKYQETIKNSRSQQDKDQEYRRFFKECLAQFNASNINDFEYLDRVGYNEDRRRLIDAVNNDEHYSLNGAIVLLPVNAPFESRNGSTLSWAVASFTIGSIAFMVLLSFIKLKEQEKDISFCK